MARQLRGALAGGIRSVLAEASPLPLSLSSSLPLSSLSSSLPLSSLSSSLPLSSSLALTRAASTASRAAAAGLAAPGQAHSRRSGSTSGGGAGEEAPRRRAWLPAAAVAALGTGGAVGWVAYHIRDGRQAAGTLLDHVQTQCVASLPMPTQATGEGSGMMAVDADGNPLPAAAAGGATAAVAAAAGAVAMGGGLTPEAAAGLEEAARLGIVYEQWVLDTWVARAALPHSDLLRRRMATVVRQLDIDMAAAAMLIHAQAWDGAYQHIMALLRRMSALAAGAQGAGGDGGIAGASGERGGARLAQQVAEDDATVAAALLELGVWRRMAVLSDWLASLATNTPGLPPDAAAALAVDASRAAVDAMLKQYPGAAMSEAARAVAWRQAGVGRHVIRVPYAPLSGAIHVGNLHLLCVNAAKRAVAHVPVGGVVGAMALRDVAIDAVPSLLASAAGTAEPAPALTPAAPPADGDGGGDAPTPAAPAPAPTTPPPPPGYANVTVAVSERLGPGAYDAALRKVAAPLHAKGMQVRLADECTPEYTAGMRWWPSPIYAAPVEVAYNAAQPLVSAAGTALQAGLTARLRASDTAPPAKGAADTWGAGFMAQVVALTGKCLAVSRERVAAAEETLPAATAPTSPQALALHADVAANTFLFLLLPNLLLWSYREHGLTPAAAFARGRELVAAGHTGIPPMLQTAWVKLSGAATAAGVSPALADVPHLPADAAVALLGAWRTEMSALVTRLVPAAAAAAVVTAGGTRAARAMTPGDWAAAVMHALVTTDAYHAGGQRAMLTSLVAAGAPVEAASAGTFHLWAHSLLAHAFTDARVAEALAGMYEDEYATIAAAQAALK